MPTADDALLREQVRMLGKLLGDTVAELRGPAALELVERTRRAAVALREGKLPGGRDAFAASIAALGIEDLELLAKAFTDFFQLINAAEEQHRIRALRGRDTAAPIDGSIAAACAELAAGGVSAADVQALLDRLLVMPVLTAHPTEARRRTVLDHLAEVAAALDRLDDPRLGARERGRADERLAEVVSAIVSTRSARTSRPTPLDEIRSGLLVFERTLLDVVPRVYRELARGLRDAYPGAAFRVGPFLRFGTWIGGDRDGNPSVTAEVTRAALERQRAVALARYAADVAELWRELSAAAPVHRAEALAELEASIAADRARGIAPALATRALREDERWREKLRFVAARLEAARVRAEGGYPSPEPYLADLELLQRTLRAAGLGRAAGGRLEDARRRAEVFGFHLATLDVRQHSGVHERVVAELLAQGGTDGYAHLPEARRVALLAELAARPALPLPDRARLSPEAREALDTIEVVGWARRDLGPAACERYVVSFTAAVSDLLEVIFLARAARLAPDELRPIPLLEQLEDLERAGHLAREALSIAPLRAALGGELEVMIGYSDSGKQVGYVPSRVALHKAQLALAQVAEAEGVTLTIFHGRGGAVGRGGGPANRAIRAQPAAALRGRFRVTEQGETVAARYGRAEIARRDLEQMVNAVLSASAGAPRRAAEAAADAREAILDRAAAAALERYRALLVHPDRLARYALAATPLEEVPELRFASRPASRAGRLTLDSLRAIPWVFAWNQSRHGIPGWFGLGSALDAATAEHGEGAVRDLYARWPLVRALVDDARLALTQADLDVAAHYARLAAPGDRSVFEAIREEHARTLAAVRRITGQEELLAPWPTLARAAARRNPYIDVLSHVQVELLRRGRAAPEQSERNRDVLLLTVNGIAAGLQTVG
ncbi:MAG TPA: phosphoenolpyruvate carboxylase [Anaeromyxobacter sp.]|nr:phosphoenolpyruvate carboxylase [Anaeromyxobacter sp.]